jgi:hypothetical protein
MTKRTAAVAAVAGAVLWAVPTVSQAAGISGSAHDFQASTWNTRKTTCGVCHCAHNANIPQLIPLWTHETTTSTFTPYSSGTMQATVGQPSSASLACLSCHDGTVAINNYGGSVQGTAEYVTGNANFGTDLSNDHPISFTYDAALATADGFLNDPTTYLVTGPDFTGTKTIDQEMLRNHKIECASCHDIHKQRGASKTSSIMLIMSGSSYAGSKLCLTCHIK